MKSVINLLFILSLSANGSFFQVDCRNGSGTVVISSGHSRDEILLTKGSVINGRYKEERVSFDNLIYSEELGSKNILLETSELICHPGSNHGYSSWKEVWTKKVKITRKDGESLPSDILGLSKDQKKVEVILLCEENGNSETLCDID